MTGKSASELEREADAIRANIMQTAEVLQNRMTPSHVLDDLGSYFRNSEGAMAFENLKTQVRDNPLPLALVGAGLAWLFMGGGPKSSTIARTADPYSHPDGGGTASGEVWPDSPGLSETELGAGLSGETATRETSGGAMASAASRVSSAYESATRKASSAAGSAADTTSHLGHRTAEAGRYAASQARHAGSRAQRMVSETFDQEPLIIGALGVAVGAAIAAMMPRTRFEEEYVEPYAEKAQESAKDAMQRGTESAKKVASEAYRAGEKEAERQAERSSARGSAGTSTAAAASRSSKETEEKS